MTGFARVVSSISPRLTVAITIRSVNHRYLELSVRLPEFLWETEGRVRAAATRALGRGKVDLSVRAQRVDDPEFSVRVNRKVADSAVPMLRTILDDYGMTSALAPSDLLRIPNLLVVDAEELDVDDAERAAFDDAVTMALESLIGMREAEGKGLRTDLLARLDSIDAMRVKALDERETIATELREQFRQRVSDIATAVDTVVSEERVAQELVMLAEKSDVAEELTRLEIHIVAARKLIDGPEPAGKKLDFLSQEILREINTLGQKSRSAKIRSLVVEWKTEVERIREQVQNVE